VSAYFEFVGQINKVVRMRDDTYKFDYISRETDCHSHSIVVLLSGWLHLHLRVSPSAVGIFIVDTFSSWTLQHEYAMYYSMWHANIVYSATIVC